MTQNKEIADKPGDQQQVPVKRRLVSKKVTDHLANERTFLAWIRTGLATITSGFVVQRFGLLLRQLGAKIHLTSLKVREKDVSIPTYGKGSQLKLPPHNANNRLLCLLTISRPNTNSLLLYQLLQT